MVYCYSLNSRQSPFITFYFMYRWPKLRVFLEDLKNQISQLRTGCAIRGEYYTTVIEEGKLTLESRLVTELAC